MALLRLSVSSLQRLGFRDVMESRLRAIRAFLVRKVPLVLQVATLLFLGRLDLLVGSVALDLARLFQSAT
jgi:hypothetical protein